MSTLSCSWKRLSYFNLDKLLQQMPHDSDMRLVLRLSSSHARVSLAIGTMNGTNGTPLSSNSSTTQRSTEGEAKRIYNHPRLSKVVHKKQSTNLSVKAWLVRIVNSQLHKCSLRQHGSDIQRKVLLTLITPTPASRSAHHKAAHAWHMLLGSHGSRGIISVPHWRSTPTGGR